MNEASSPGVIDFLTHSEVRIRAGASAVWSVVARPAAGVQRLVPIGGEPGQVGERFHAVDSSAPDVPLFFVENVELAPERRRTVRLDGLEGAFMGFAAWVLRPDGAETVLTYDVYCRYAGLPPGSSPADHMAASQRMMDEGLLRLKRIVEGGGAAS
jgi:hypothetical protein